MSESIRIKELWVYPIKSLGGIRLPKAQLCSRGLQYDRRWMLLDAEGNFLTQRQHPHMALLKLSLEEEHLRITHTKKSLPPLYLPLHPQQAIAQLEAPIWDDRTLAWHLNPDYDRWFTEALDLPCRLVYMPEESPRSVSGKYSGLEQPTSFVDDYPILMIGQASLDALNDRLPSAIPMDRFRPNLVIEGAPAHAEDSWHEFEIRGLEFRAEKPCARCVVTTIDQQSAEKSPEPLRTLAKYRKLGNKLLFGQYVLCPSEGTISVGDTLQINSLKPDPLHEH